MITNENISIIKQYLDYPQKIKQLKYDLSMVSTRYYMEHSFIGSGIPCDLSDPPNRAIRPDEATVIIMTKEQNIRNRLMRLEKRYKLFEEEFTPNEIRSLKYNFYGKLSLIKRACNQIEAIDAYIENQKRNAPAICYKNDNKAVRKGKDIQKNEIKEEKMRDELLLLESEISKMLEG